MYLAAADATISISDTVGFIRDLPHGLVAAFSATLQESVEANLLLHVVDAANPASFEQIEEVRRVLHDIGAGDIEQILVFNKLDLIAHARTPERMQDVLTHEGHDITRLFVSAHTGEGLDALRALLAERYQSFMNPVDAYTPTNDDPRFAPIS